MSLPDHLVELLEELLDLDPGVLSPASTLTEFEGWESVNQLRILVQIEKRVNVSLDFEAFMGVSTVGELVGLVKAAEPTASQAGSPL
jgi:acyl carrier protein